MFEEAAPFLFGALLDSSHLWGRLIARGTSNSLGAPLSLLLIYGGVATPNTHLGVVAAVTEKEVDRGSIRMPTEQHKGGTSPVYTRPLTRVPIRIKLIRVHVNALIGIAIRVT